MLHTRARWEGEREAHGEKVQVLKKQPAGGSSGTLGFILLFLLFHFPSLLNPQILITQQKKEKKK